MDKLVVWFQFILREEVHFFAQMPWEVFVVVGASMAIMLVMLLTFVAMKRSAKG